MLVAGCQSEVVRAEPPAPPPSPPPSVSLNLRMNSEGVDARVLDEKGQESTLKIDDQGMALRGADGTRVDVRIDPKGQVDMEAVAPVAPVPDTPPTPTVPAPSVAPEGSSANTPASRTRAPIRSREKLTVEEVGLRVPLPEEQLVFPRPGKVQETEFGVTRALGFTCGGTPVEVVSFYRAWADRQPRPNTVRSGRVDRNDPTTFEFIFEGRSGYRVTVLVSERDPSSGSDLDPRVRSSVTVFEHESRVPPPPR